MKPPLANIIAVHIIANSHNQLTTNKTLKQFITEAQNMKNALAQKPTPKNTKILERFKKTFPPPPFFLFFSISSFFTTEIIFYILIFLIKNAPGATNKHKKT